MNTAPNNMTVVTKSPTVSHLPIGHGGILGPAGLRAVPIAEIDRIVTSDTSNNSLVLPPTDTITFQFLFDLSRPQITLLTNFSGEEYHYDIVDIYERARTHQDPHLLAETLWLDALCRELNGDKADIVLMLFALSIVWPESAFRSLQKIRNEIISGELALIAGPTAWTLFFAAKILLKCLQDLPPTNVSPLINGGVILSWSSQESYCDVEINNDREVVFYLSTNRKRIDMLVISNDDEGIEEGLSSVRKSMKNETNS